MTFFTSSMSPLGGALLPSFRDWSLITGREGLQNEHVKFYPYKKGAGKSCSHAEREGTKSFGVVFKW